MRLKRIRDHDTAESVARGVKRFNGVHITPRRVLVRPHYGIRVSRKLAGWIGVEARRPGWFEVCHLSVLPRYRRRGLARLALLRVLSLVRAWGGHYAYARIVSGNRPSICLFRRLGFRRTGGKSILVFGRAV